jgi:tetratricopeptide (TPR) repeat protein
MTRLPRFLASTASFVLACAVVSSATAAPSPPPRQEPPPPPASTNSSLLGDTLSASSAKSAARTQAEAYYAAGYKDVDKAKKDKQAGKANDAKKRFGKARGKFEEAVKLDPDYFEAWNMLGFSARQSGDLKAAFAAYDKCLAIKPDYDEAHEYRGEAYLMNGQIDLAKQELAWLKAEGSDEAEELAEAIEKAEGKKAGAKEDGAESKDSDAKPAEAKASEAKTPEAK